MKSRKTLRDCVSVLYRTHRRNYKGHSLEKCIAEAHGSQLVKFDLSRKEAKMRALFLISCLKGQRSDFFLNTRFFSLKVALNNWPV